MPAAVRTALGIDTGDRVEFIEIAPGHFELVAATRPGNALKGLVRKPAKPLSFADALRAPRPSGSSRPRLTPIADHPAHRWTAGLTPKLSGRQQAPKAAVDVPLQRRVGRLHGTSTSTYVPGAALSTAATTALATRWIRGQLVVVSTTMASFRDARFC